jgi:hypothetical protein
METSARRKAIADVSLSRRSELSVFPWMTTKVIYLQCAFRHLPGGRVRLGYGLAGANPDPGRNVTLRVE